MPARRPAFQCGAGFVVGTLGGIHWGDPSHIAWPALALVLLAAGLLRPSRARGWLCLAAALFLGWALATRPGDRLRADRAQLAAAADTGTRLTVVGEVAGVPRRTRASRGEVCHRFTLTRIELVENGRRTPIPRTALSVHWYGPASPGAAHPLPGERWRLDGRLQWSRQARFAGGVGREQAIRFLLVSRARASAREPPPATGWRAWLEGRRRAAADRLAAGIEAHPDEILLIQGMMLGYRGEMPRVLTRAFRHSGTIHIFAISGLHVVVIAALLTFAVARLGVPRPFWILPLAPILAIYIIATGAQPSALRAGLMSGIYLLAPLLGRRPDTLTTLAVSAVVLLLANPLQILDLGFILSFMMVLGLIILAGPSGRLARRLLRVDRLAQRVELVNEQGGEAAGSVWRQKLRQAGLALAEGFAGLLGVSTAAWLISIPLTAYAFGYFSTYSLLANLVVVPLSSLVMLLASLSLLVASVATPLCLLCNQGVWLGTALMKQIALTVTGWPHATLAWRPPFSLVILWYGVLWTLAWREARAHARAESDATWLETVRDQGHTQSA
ncbi:MAG: ComEC family competence protein [Lentisphaerae bacterium]|nr:ComEC family competence protein [Lentisphaerota bacterium]